MKHRSSEQWRRGTAAVELAVLLPFLIFMLLIVWDWGRILYYSLTLANCARNGAYYASSVDNYVGWEDGGTGVASIQQAAVVDGAALNPPLATGNVVVTTGTDSKGNAMTTVTVTYTFTTLVTYPGIPHTVNLSRAAQARVAPAVAN